MNKKALGLAIIAIALAMVMVISAVPPVIAGTPDVSGTGEVAVFWDRWNSSSAAIAGMALWYYMGPGCRTQFLYTAQELANYDVTAGPIGEVGMINAWGKTSNALGYWAANNNYLNLRFIMSNVPTTKTSLVSTYALNYGADGGVFVYYAPGWTNINGFDNQAFWFDISASGFIYEGNGLVFEVAYDSISGSMGYFGLITSTLTAYWSGNPYVGCIWYYYSSTSPTGYSYTGHINVLTLSIAAIPATTRIEPQTLNLDSMGNWVNVKVEDFPENPEYSPMDVDGTSVAVAGTGTDLKFGTWNENRWIGKCDRLAVEDAIGAPGEEVELAVTGQTTDGTAFMSTAIIRAIQN
jgi:hypothetical protein